LSNPGNAQVLEGLFDKKSPSLFLFRGINKQERWGIAGKSKADLKFSRSVYPGESIGIGCYGAGGLSWQYILVL